MHLSDHEEFILQESSSKPLGKQHYFDVIKVSDSPLHAINSSFNCSFDISFDETLAIMRESSGSDSFELPPAHFKSSKKQSTLSGGGMKKRKREEMMMEEEERCTEVLSKKKLKVTEEEEERGQNTSK